ncbi:MAG TPA: helicase C-terminal domain-containing protein [Thermoanaerobaculia bacterium]|jgi:Rad3-related DNA helicase|nr:helicase C-terminal domain-containing protein [Thermoanaerobaculia bacterium]
MPPRFDPDLLRVELSVADLLERELAGSLAFGQRGGYERLWLGQAIHSRYQEAALAGDPSYRREVAVAAELTHRGWQVLLRGRLDGLRREKDGSLVVEEIKSVRRGGQLPPSTRELYERQALLYAWLLRLTESAPVSAELVLIEIGSDAVERVPLQTSWAALEGEVRRRLSALFRGYEAERAAMEERRRVAATLAFPYRQQRPGQERIIEAVETALQNRDHLLLEAPTGIGKTVAALYPALRYALAHGKRVFVLTAKTLQQDMAMKVLSLLNGDEAFRSLRLRAKAKMCANGEVICHEEYCPYARDYYGKLKTAGTVPRLMAEHPTLEPDEVYHRARADEVCPFEVSLDLAHQVQVVVCDYNYAFDPYVALSEFGAEGDLADSILVIDEIHNLVERGRGYYSPSLSAAQAREAAESLRRLGDPALDPLTDAAIELARLIEQAVAETFPERPPFAANGYATAMPDGELRAWLVNPFEPEGAPQAAEAQLPEEDLWLMRPRFDGAFVDYLEWQRSNHAFRDDDPFVALYFDLLRFLDVMLVLDGAFSTLVVRTADDCQIQILCKDPSRFLGKIVNRTHTTVGLSATITPPEFYRDLLGFERGRTASLSLPDPFPESNRRVVVDATVETTWKQRPFHYPRIAERLAAFAGAVPGNCLALFPSYDFLRSVAERLQVPGKRVLIQQRADSDRTRSEMLANLRGALFGDVLLLAVAGGAFAEGVDYPGDMLQAVAVVGPCLPAVSLERKLLETYYQERFERGFEYAFVVPGMTRVVQAAGRLLRSPEDRGVIALFDRRFLAPLYAGYLPGHWLPAGGVTRLAGEPAAAAAEFFGTVPRSRVSVAPGFD